MSDFKLLFPHIPYFGGFISATDEVSTVAGPARDFYETSSAVTSKTFSYDVYGSPFAGIGPPLLDQYYNPEYLCLLGINDILDKDGGSVSWQIADTASPANTDSGTITSASLIDTNKYFTAVDLGATSTISRLDLEFSWTNSLVFKISKIFLGKEFDFGRNPIINSDFNISRDDKIKPLTTGRLEFEGISKTVAQNFYQYIAPHLNSMTFFLYDVNTCLLQTQLLYCTITDYRINIINDRECDITLNYEELY